MFMIILTLLVVGFYLRHVCASVTFIFGHKSNHNTETSLLNYLLIYSYIIVFFHTFLLCSSLTSVFGFSVNNLIPIPKYITKYIRAAANPKRKRMLIVLSRSQNSHFHSCSDLVSLPSGQLLGQWPLTSRMHGITQLNVPDTEERERYWDRVLVSPLLKTVTVCENLQRSHVVLQSPLCWSWRHREWKHVYFFCLVFFTLFF